MGASGSTQAGVHTLKLSLTLLSRWLQTAIAEVNRVVRSLCHFYHYICLALLLQTCLNYEAALLCVRVTCKTDILEEPVSVSGLRKAGDCDVARLAGLLHHLNILNIVLPEVNYHIKIANQILI